MNGAGIKGGAFGFRVSSINKVTWPAYRCSLCLMDPPSQLVDTKSVNNTTLLHFLERTVAKHFSAMEDFLDELTKPAEAYRGKFFSGISHFTTLIDGVRFQSTSKMLGKVLPNCGMGSRQFGKNSTNISLRLSRTTGIPSRCGALREKRPSSWKTSSMMSTLQILCSRRW